MLFIFDSDRKNVLKKISEPAILQILICLFINCFTAFGHNYSAAKPIKANTANKKNQRYLIPIHFKLAEGGYVSLVIENTSGVRVRNLVSETWFPAGENIAWWNGCSDLDRDADAANKGIYVIPASFVNAGKYRVRGIYRKVITTHYEFSVYSSGHPPWNTSNHTGGWLAEHTPPQAAAFLPGRLSPVSKPLMLLGCYVAEGKDGFIWTNLDGEKLGGKKWIGGVWTAAPFIATDNCATTSSVNSAYVAAAWKTGKAPGQMELRINALSVDKSDFKVKEVGKFLLGKFLQEGHDGVINGLAVYDQMAVVSLAEKDQLLIIDTKKGMLADSISIDKPGGIMIDSAGRLLVLSGQKLISFKSLAAARGGAKPKIIINNGLEDPFAVTKDRMGQYYISDRGNSHTVKVFSAKGHFIKNIGKPGAPGAGVYDLHHMNNPAGITIDERQHLWVAEDDYLPKRVTVWSLDGQLLHAFYGPSKYGGGGTLDENKTKFYYAEEDKGSMEFALDWAKGSWELSNILYRSKPGELKLALRSAAPETPLYLNGKRYFTNCYNSFPASGSSVAFIFIDRDGIAVPAAAMGKAADWDALKQDKFKKYWPAGTNLQVNRGHNDVFFYWEDNNTNGRAEPDEVIFQQGSAMGVTVMPDLSFCIANLDGKSVKFSPVKFALNGGPQYNIAAGEVLATGVLPPASSGGAQVLSSSNGWSVVTLGIQPFSALSLCGTKNGKVMWSYPDLWPGLHASHQAPIANRPGMLIGTTRLLGGLVKVKDPRVPALWAINGNHGTVYMFTDDGIFVTTLFKYKSIGAKWQIQSAERNMNLDSLTLDEENFWPAITKTYDDNVYLTDGNRSSIVRLDGLQTIRRLPDSYLTVTEDDLRKSKQIILAQAKAIQKQTEQKILKVALLQKKPIIDGDLTEWNTTQWMQVTNREPGITRNKLPNCDIFSSMSVYGNRLYIMYCTCDSTLIGNSGENLLAPFKTGGALDLMIGTTDKANPDRVAPVAGDCRLMIYTVKGRPHALLYRALVPGIKSADKIPFSSPSHTITFDSVVDITPQLEFAAKNGNYECSVPLSIFNIKPVADMHIKGDLGILRGKNGQTISRSYWSNKKTATTADVPSEAMLTPNLWGTFIFKKVK